MFDIIVLSLGLMLSPFNSSDWVQVPDLEERFAEQLKPKTMAYSEEYDSGLVEVVHIVGPVEYRILTYKGDVSYSYRVLPY